MRIAAFDIENLLERSLAMNLPTWSRRTVSNARQQQSIRLCLLSRDRKLRLDGVLIGLGVHPFIANDPAIGRLPHGHLDELQELLLSIRSRSASSTAAWMT